MELKTGDKINISFKDSGKVLLREIEILDVETWNDVPADDVEYGLHVYVMDARGKMARFCEQEYSFEVVGAVTAEVTIAIPARRPFEFKTEAAFAVWFERTSEMMFNAKDYAEYVAQNTPTVEPAPRELNAFEKLLAGAKFQTVAEVAPEAIERAAKIREIEQQAAAAAAKFAGRVEAEKDEQELSWNSPEHKLVRRAYHDVYEAEYRRLLKEAGL